MTTRRLLATLVLLLAGAAGADERILSYDSRIEIRPDGSLDVSETIRVNAEHTKIRHGIFREFPTLYTDRQGRRTTVSFDLQSVRRDGAPEPYRTERRLNGVAIYIGRGDQSVSRGEHTYEIHYRTDRQLGFFADHDELYWNVTGVDWDFHIETATAEVYLPAGAPAHAIHLEAYTGPMGATWRNYRAQLQDGVARFETTRPLATREGLTIVVTWPKGLVAAPSALMQARHFVRDNQPLVSGAVGLLGLLGYYLMIWNWVGRDPRRGVIVPRYRPPEGETPASMRFLQRMGYDNTTFVAGVLELAVKGYLVVEQQGGKYVLQRKQGSTTPLMPDEHALLRTVFAAGDSLLLDDSNHRLLHEAKKAHERQLEQKHNKRSFHLNSGWRYLGMALTVFVLVPLVAVAAVNAGYGPEWFFLTPPGWGTLALVPVALVVNNVFMRLLRAPTREGRRRMDEIEGFRLYLTVAEGDELALAGAPRKTPSLFEMYLPFALALGVSQQWSEKFAQVFLTQAPQDYAPDWYRGDRWDIGDVRGFSRSLSGSFDSAISSASTAPGESSGSSSGGGGGGSSGGGGGGGGGGGW